ncbi:MAG: hypothetical protein ACOX3T_07430 [Bdellovibrionota bacterium]
MSKVNDIVRHNLEGWHSAKFLECFFSLDLEGVIKALNSIESDEWKRLINNTDIIRVIHLYYLMLRAIQPNGEQDEISANKIIRFIEGNKLIILPHEDEEAFGADEYTIKLIAEDAAKALREEDQHAFEVLDAIDKKVAEAILDLPQTFQMLEERLDIWASYNNTIVGNKGQPPSEYYNAEEFLRFAYENKLMSDEENNIIYRINEKVQSYLAKTLNDYSPSLPNKLWAYMAKEEQERFIRDQKNQNKEESFACEGNDKSAADFFVRILLSCFINGDFATAKVIVNLSCRKEIIEALENSIWYFPMVRASINILNPARNEGNNLLDPNRDAPSRQANSKCIKALMDWAEKFNHFVVKDENLFSSSFSEE